MREWVHRGAEKSHDVKHPRPSTTPTRPGYPDILEQEGSHARMRIILTANTCFKIANFRAGLVGALIARGCEVVVLAPMDSHSAKLTAMGCRVLDLPMDRNGTAPLAELGVLWRIWSFSCR